MEKIERLGARVESDHQPLELTLEEEREKEREKDKMIKEIVQWDEESIRKYQETGKKIEINGENVEKL